MNEKREYEKEEDFTITAQRKKFSGHVFLFSDSLLITQPETKLSKFSFRKMIHLENIRVEDVKSGKFPFPCLETDLLPVCFFFFQGTLRDSKSFKVVDCSTSPEQVYVFSSKIDGVKEDWIKRITEVKNTKQTDRSESTTPPTNLPVQTNPPNETPELPSPNPPGPSSSPSSSTLPPSSSPSLPKSQTTESNPSQSIGSRIRSWSQRRIPTFRVSSTPPNSSKVIPKKPSSSPRGQHNSSPNIEPTTKSPRDTVKKETTKKEEFSPKEEAVKLKSKNGKK